MARRSWTKICGLLGGFRRIDCRFRHLPDSQSVRNRRLDLLRSLYQELVIPPAVATELQRNGVDHRTHEWLLLTEPTNREVVKQLELRLDPGEAEAIAVALELRADRILIDERRARRVASEINLRPLGLLGILAEGKQRGVLQQCKPVLDDIIQITGFWIGERLYAQFLAAVDESR